MARSDQWNKRSIEFGRGTILEVARKFAQGCWYIVLAFLLLLQFSLSSFLFPFLLLVLAIIYFPTLNRMLLRNSERKISNPQDRRVLVFLVYFRSVWLFLFLLLFPCILSGIRFRDVKLIDSIFKMCCALHNILLDVDGLSAQWEDESFDEAEYEDLPLQRLRNLSADDVRRQHQVMYGHDAAVAGNVDVGADVEVELGHAEFRKALIENFNYRFNLPADHPDCPKWPRRNSVIQPLYCMNQDVDEAP